MWRRFLPLIVLALVAGIVFATGLHRHLSLDALGQHYEALRAWADARPVLAPLAFGAVYAAAVALSVPGALILTLASGLMFGLVLGCIVVVIAATAGATIIFIIAKTAVGDVLRRRAGGWVARMEQGFRADALSYLLVLRLIPIFPFWLVNIVPAILNVRLRTYVLATFIGIIPGSAVYTSVGNGLGALLAVGEQPDLGIIFRPEIIGPLLGLAALALLPMAYKRWSRARSTR